MGNRKSSSSPGRDAVLLGVSIIAYVALFSFFSIMRYLASNPASPDFSIFNQGFYTALKYGMPFFNTFENNSHFAQHCSPIFYLILPFYGLCPGIPALAVIQSLALGLGAIPVFLTAREILGRKSMPLAGELSAGFDRAPLLFALLYLLYHPLHGINYDQFNELSLSVLPTAFGIYFFIRRRMFPFWCCLLLVLMCKEDASFVLIFWGLYMIAISRILEKTSKLWLHGIAMTTLGAVYLYICLYVVVPHFNVNGHYGYFQERYGYLGSTLPEVIRTIFMRPFYVLRVLLEKPRFLYFLEMFLPLAFIPLRSPGLLWMTVPTFGINMLSNMGYMHSSGARYSAYLIPFLFASAMFAFRKLTCGREPGSRFDPYFLGRLATPADKVKRLFKIMFTLTILCTLFINNTPLRIGFRIPKVTPHQEIILRLVRAIPPAASISTQIDILQHVSSRLKAYSGYSPGSDFVFVDESTQWFNEQAQWDKVLSKALGEGCYEKIFYREGIRLYVKKDMKKSVSLPADMP